MTCKIVNKRSLNIKSRAFRWPNKTHPSGMSETVVTPSHRYPQDPRLPYPHSSLVSPVTPLCCRLISSTLTSARPPARPQSSSCQLPACSPASPIHLLCRPVSSIWRLRPCTDLRRYHAAVAAGLRSPPPAARPLSKATYPCGHPCPATIAAAAPLLPAAPPKRHTPAVVLAGRRSLPPSHGRGRGHGHGGGPPLPLPAASPRRHTPPAIRAG